MGRSNTVILAGAVLAAFALGLLVGKGVSRGDAELRDSAGRSLILPELRSGAEEGERRAFQRVRDPEAPRPAAETPRGFAFDRLRLETSDAAPRACLQFTQDLDDSGSVNYADYLRVTPSEDRPAVSVAGKTLCLTGLQFDKDYTARLRAGLPDARGEKLARPVDVAIAFGDKPAYVGFAGDGVILPRLEADGLGIETVNVEEVEITIRRVSDRSLARKQIVKGESVPENDYFYVYGEEDGEDVGVVVFQDVIETPSPRNEAETTVFPLGAALPDLKPGAYFIRVRDVSPGADERRTAQAWRWVMFTDIALTTYSSGQGIDVFARSLTTARPLGAVQLTLIAANNDELARATTNAEGRARFDEAVINGDGPLRPRMIMAYGAQQDFAAIDLQRAPLDLSDRNVAGRDAPAKLDAFVYLDRGVYRPGETAHITGLLRDAAGAAADRPLKLSIRRPNYTEAYTSRIAALDVGAFQFDFDVPASAPRGVWRVEIEADGVGLVGSEDFSVEDFVPQRLEVTLDTDEKTPIRAGETRLVEVESRFLYGAPAANLAVEAEARLRLDPNPFPDYAKFRFGPVDGRFDERFLKLDNTTTDESGAARIELNVDGAPNNYGAPLRADLVVGVIEPGGRAVRESARIPVRPDDRYVGLKLAGDGAGVGQGEPAEVEAVLLDWRGAQVAAELEWRLVEEDYWFDWYRENGEWRWRRSYKDVLIGEGRAAAVSDDRVKIAQQLQPGSYRMSVTDPQSGAKTDIRFYVGWRSYAAGADTPDQAGLALTSDSVTPGSRARLFLDPPYGGEAIITVATDKVHLVQRVKVEPNGREIIIDTDPAWGAGFYVLTTVVTPRDAVKQPVPRRAMGVAYVPFDMSARTLNVAINAPALMRPRQQAEIPVRIEGAQQGENVMLTLAAVDEGILRLTKFESPDPVDYFYGQKRLGVEVRDDYGRILHANLGAATSFGGDQLGGEGLTVVPTKSVALFRGPVELGPGGTADVPINVPDFNGELRLMAVAWSANKLGAAARPMTVRDEVPAELALPRFLAPGDTAQTTLLIDNVDGAPGDYAVALFGSGPVRLDAEETIPLAAKEQKTARFEIGAGGAGVGSVQLRVEGADGFEAARGYPIEVRTPYFPITDVSTRQIEPGETLSISKALIEPFTPGTASLTVSFSRLRGVEPGPLLDALYRYPYGCTEQLTSAATPLLFVDVLGGEIGRGPERAVRPRIQTAINKLLERQSADGAFGLWREGDRAASPWLGAYVTEFLQRAKSQGYGVPDDAMTRAYSAMEDVARTDRWTAVNYQMRAYEGTGSTDTTERLRLRAAAYALYVLARAGRADLSDLRYYHDALMDKVQSPLAKAHIAAALGAMGDRARAVSGFRQALDALGHENASDYYQTPLRDAAGVLALAAEAGEADVVDTVSERFVNLMKEPSRMHTQEKAFVLLASQALLRAAGPVSLSRNGDEISIDTPAPAFPIELASFDDDISFANTGDGPIFGTVTVSGAPERAPAPSANGYTVTKRIATRDGRAVDLAGVAQNDRFVVVISGEAAADRLHPTIVADLLPAGFEIETVLRPEDGARNNNAGPYGWIGPISRTKIAEARDDRFVAAIDVRRERFTLAYVVRAVTPGDFAMPGVVVEDMYHPGVAARTASGRVTIAPAG